jgi:hypothetical protein
MGDTFVHCVPVHGSNLISSAVLLPRNQTGNYDTALVAAHCSRPCVIVTDYTGTSDVEGSAKTGNVAG